MTTKQKIVIRVSDALLYAILVAAVIVAVGGAGWIIAVVARAAVQTGMLG